LQHWAHIINNCAP
jgi:hypothetical protein